MLNTLSSLLLETLLTLQHRVSINLMPDIVTDQITQEKFLVIRQVGNANSGQLVVVAEIDLGPHYPVASVNNLIGSLTPDFLEAMANRMVFANGGNAHLKLTNSNTFIQVETFIKGVAYYEHWDISSQKFVEAFGI